MFIADLSAISRNLFFIFSLISINCLSQQYSKSWKDLNYADDAMVYHRLDFYLPKVEKPTYPAVISIYGSTDYIFLTNSVNETVNIK